ncbi:hypothetical protein [Marinitenerispora sediminis]|uniref:hypothetical protein n=1 Tax=Marinitenerispora sediminis TaxID=1931232 RepID=UPI0011C07C96|nr:hypothetical protein [Marinitenerispora sediminis]
MTESATSTAPRASCSIGPIGIHQPFRGSWPGCRGGIQIIQARRCGPQWAIWISTLPSRVGSLSWRSV